MHINNETLITQKIFRILLQAMSHPGRVYRVYHQAELRNTERDNDHLSSILLTLLDHEVGFCVIGPDKEHLEPAVSERFRSPLKPPEEADFMIVSGGESHGEILKAKRGSLEYPDTGATVIYQVTSLKNQSEGNKLARLKGPGISTAVEPGIQGLGRNELSYLKEINSEYPLGLDCIFIDGTDRLMCIPRSTRIEVV